MYMPVKNANKLMHFTEINKLIILEGLFNVLKWIMLLCPSQNVFMI